MSSDTFPSEPDEDDLYDDHYDEYNDYGDDDDESDIDNCSGFFDHGVFVCMAAGSEDCDWECPFSRDIGMTAKEIERRDMQELADAIEQSKQKKG